MAWVTRDGSRHLGLSAVTKTSTLGASAKRTSAAAIATRAKKLDAFEAALQKALKNKPPALPKVPVVRAVSPHSGRVSRARFTRQRVDAASHLPASGADHHPQAPSHQDDGREAEGRGRTGGGDD